MRPLNDDIYFGDAGIGVTFHNGTASVPGYITRQHGTSTFMCTDGTVTKKVKLAPTTVIAGALTDGYCTIAITGPSGPEHVKRIWSEKLVTLEGGHYKWSLGTSVNGSVVVPAAVGPTGPTGPLLFSAEKADTKAESAKAEPEVEAPADVKTKSAKSTKPTA